MLAAKNTVAGHLVYIRSIRSGLKDLEVLFGETDGQLANLTQLQPPVEVVSAVARCTELLRKLYDTDADDAYCQLDPHLQKPLKAVSSKVGALQRNLAIREELVKHFGDEPTTPGTPEKAGANLLLLGSISGELRGVGVHTRTAWLSGYVDTLVEKQQQGLLAMTAATAGAVETVVVEKREMPVHADRNEEEMMSDVQALLDTDVAAAELLTDTEVFLELRSTALGTIRNSTHMNRPSLADMARYVGTMWYLVEHAPAAVQRETARLCMTSLCSIAERYMVPVQSISNGYLIEKMAEKCEE